MGKGNRSAVRAHLDNRATTAALALVLTLALAAALVAVPRSDAQATEVDTEGRSVLYYWTVMLLETMELNPPAPTPNTWRILVVMTSVYEAWGAYDHTALRPLATVPRRPATERTVENKEAAVSYAAHRALSFAYPNQQAMFDAGLAHLGYPLSASTDVTTPAGVGNVSAQAVIDDRLADGSNAAAGFGQTTSLTYPTLYEPVNSPDAGAPNAPGGALFDPNRWQPLRVPNGTATDANGFPVAVDDDPSTYTDQTFLTPHWGAVRPFALAAGDQFRPPPPPQFGSDAPYTDSLGTTTTSHEAWLEQHEEVLSYSANLTDEHKVIAEVWADGPHTWTPPGHWLQIALGLCIRDEHSLDEDVEMFYTLAGALFDTGISVWEAKRAYDFVRPVSAIRHHWFDEEIEGWGGPDMGTVTMLGQEWRPYQDLTFVTPPFAEFTSGHSGFSRASREVLRAYTGTDALYDGVTRLGADFDGDGEEDYLGRHVALPGSNLFESSPSETVVLTWDTLLDAADEAAISRLYGGIHIRDGDLRSREMGRQVGELAFAHGRSQWAPFDHFRDTVARLKAEGHISGGADSALVSRATTAESRFLAGQDRQGCQGLATLQGQLDAFGGGSKPRISEAAHAELSALVDGMRAQLCAG